MSHQTLGLVIGGIIPAILYGFTGVFTKASIQADIGLGIFIILVGISIAVTGLFFLKLEPGNSLNMTSGLYAIGQGLTWGIATGCVSLGIMKYHVPLGKLVPLYNMNTLVAVLLALWVFAEWKTVKVPQLLLGSLLIVIGGTLVSKS